MPKRILIAGAVLVALTGCIDMKQDLNVQSDGTATLAMEISIDAAMLAMTAQNQSGPSKFCTSPTSAAEGVTVTVESRTERGDMVCMLKATGHVDRVAELMAQGNLMSSATGGSSSPDAKPPAMSLTKDGANYRFDVAMDYEKPAPPKEGAPDMSKMLIAMVAGRSLSWSVTAPSIIQTSGQLSQDGKTASYSVPLASLVSGDIPRAEFTATFSTGSGSGLMDWIGNLFGG